MKAFIYGMPGIMLLMCLDATYRFWRGDDTVTFITVTSVWAMFLIVLAVIREQRKELADIDARYSRPRKSEEGVA